MSFALGVIKNLGRGIRCHRHWKRATLLVTERLLLFIKKAFYAMLFVDEYILAKFSYYPH